jgi:hypothetical protein
MSSLHNVSVCKHVQPGSNCIHLYPRDGSVCHHGDINRRQPIFTPPNGSLSVHVCVRNAIHMSLHFTTGQSRRMCVKQGGRLHLFIPQWQAIIRKCWFLTRGGRASYKQPTESSLPLGLCTSLRHRLLQVLCRKHIKSRRNTQFGNCVPDVSMGAIMT